MIGNKGFTILELIVSIAIFAFMTALLLAKYGTFNQGVLLTNLAYDVALSIRNAQSYGLNVKSASRTTDVFDKAFGVHFDKSDPYKFIFFSDNVSNGIYEVASLGGVSDVVISTTNIQRGSKVYEICTSISGSEYCDASVLDIVFKRPDPNALIKRNGGAVNQANARIKLMSTDGNMRIVNVNLTGQISVE